jgi:peroxiredoxin
MKKSILFILFIIPTLTFAQQGRKFTLHGNILGSTATRISLMTRDGYTDTTFVIDGKFVFEGKVKYPILAGIRTNDKSFRYSLWLSNEDISFNGIAGLSTGRVIGSTEQNISKEWASACAPMNHKEIQASKDEYLASISNDMDKYKSAVIQRYAVNNECYKLRESLIKKYPSSYYALSEFENLIVFSRYRYEDLSRVFGYFDKDIQNSPAGQNERQIVEAYKLTSIGQTFPNISQLDEKGDSVRISDYAGKFLLLTIGNLSLKEYTAFMPDRVSLFNEYQSKGLDMLDIVSETDVNNIKKYRADNMIPWKIISDLKGFESPVFLTLRAMPIPVNFLIAPDGKVIAANIGYDQLASKLKELFNNN